MAHILEERAPQAAPANVQWVIAVAGREEQVIVEAATLENYRASSPGDVALTTLLDADGEVVFQASTLSVAYVRRFGAPNHVIPGRA